MKSVIDSWVTEYFRLFNANPNGVAQFYEDNALFSRDDKKIYGKNRIASEYTSVGYNSPKVDLHTLKSDYIYSEPQKGEEGGVLVNAWGGITFPGQNERKFNQVGAWTYGTPLGDCYHTKCSPLKEDKK